MTGASSARTLLSALLCFTPAKPVWTVAELAARLDTSSSTMYRYVALLRDVDLLDCAGDNAYRVTERAAVLAQAAELAGSRLETVAMSVLPRIRDATEETVLIARRFATHAYCVERVESRLPVRLQFDRGQPISLHLDALARLLLALAEVSANGWTQSFEEVDQGIWGTAAAASVHGQVTAAIGVAARLYRLEARKRDRIIAEERRGGEEISAALQALPGRSD